MARWLKYLGERSPLPALALIAAGPALTGALLVGPTAARARLVLAALGIVAFLVLARLMDEVKDYEKDRLLHPQRPLPRGLISPAEAERAIRWLSFGGLVLAGLFFLMHATVAGLLVAIAFAYQWATYRGFTTRLHAGPFLDAVLHQLVILPLYGFALAAAGDRALLDGKAVAYLFAALGASLAFEVARKLDPGAPPALGGYGRVYGPPRAALLVAASLGIAALAAPTLGAQVILWPAQLLVLLALVAYLVRPRRHLLVQVTAALASFAHLWAVPLQRLGEGLP